MSATEREGGSSDRPTLMYAGRPSAASPSPSLSKLQVLTRVRRRVDRPARLLVLPGDEGADVHDPLPLLAGDASPVVRVRGVRQVLVLRELVDDRVQQVLHA